MIINPIYLKSDSGSEIGESDYIPTDIKETKEMLDLSNYTLMTFRYYNTNGINANVIVMPDYLSSPGDEIFKYKEDKAIIVSLRYLSSDSYSFDLTSSNVTGTFTSYWNITSFSERGLVFNYIITKDEVIKIKLPSSFAGYGLGFTYHNPSNVNFIAIEK